MRPAIPLLPVFVLALALAAMHAEIDAIHAASFLAGAISAGLYFGSVRP
jgi:hypothetical protein